MFAVRYHLTRQHIMAEPEIAANCISRKQLAKQLGERMRGRPYAEVTLRFWERDGVGPPVTRIGRDVVYSISSVEKWLKEQERAAKGATSASAA
jgi:hypothetical protein